MTTYKPHVPAWYKALPSKERRRIDCNIESQVRTFNAAPWVVTNARPATLATWDTPKAAKRRRARELARIRAEFNNPDYEITYY